MSINCPQGLSLDFYALSAELLKLFCQSTYDPLRSRSFEDSYGLLGKGCEDLFGQMIGKEGACFFTNWGTCPVQQS